MIKKLKENVWKLYFHEFGSCAYLIKLKNKNIIIDTSTKENKEPLIEDLKKLNLNPDEINIVILTHSHYDHVGNINLFKNAKIYASKKEFKTGLNFKIDCGNEYSLKASVNCSARAA